MWYPFLVNKTTHFKSITSASSQLFHQMPINLYLSIPSQRPTIFLWWSHPQSPQSTLSVHLIDTQLHHSRLSALHHCETNGQFLLSNSAISTNVLLLCLASLEASQPITDLAENILYKYIVAEHNNCNIVCALGSTMNKKNQPPPASVN